MCHISYRLVMSSRDHSWSDNISFIFVPNTQFSNASSTCLILMELEISLYDNSYQNFA